MQSAYLQLKHPNILRASDELSWSKVFLESITPKTSEMKKPVWPQHTGNMENAFSSEFCQGDILSQFRCDSVDSTIFHGSDRFLMEPGFLLHPASAMGVIVLTSCVSLCVTTLLDEQTDGPEIQHVGQVEGYLGQVQRSSSKVKFKGQMSRSPGQETC